MVWLKVDFDPAFDGKFLYFNSNMVWLKANGKIGDVKIVSISIPIWFD